MPIPADAEKVLVDFLTDSGLVWENPAPGQYVLTLPGEHRLTTNVSIVLGRHAVTVVAFVARHPDENHDAVHRWLMRRNARMFAVAFAIDDFGDIYLPLAAVTSEGLDQIVGAVLQYSDESFNTILELGFPSAIRREWAWRRSRGESTANLAAFAHLAQDPPPRG
jgi:hypothetical protein